MDVEYKEAIVSGQIEEALALIEEDGWDGVSLARYGSKVLVRFPGRGDRGPGGYLCRIELDGYPLRPYRIGFVEAGLRDDEALQANDKDPRYWPASFFPGLQGSFHVAYPGPYTVFWCQPCTEEYFYYHGDDPWMPRNWTLRIVVSRMWQAIGRAEHPHHWRKIQLARLSEIASQLEVTLPPGAGVGDA